uniref:Uncharacterized protein n=1 Tax=Oryza rufipogon TaxID=4529 RepID=A0A0E0QKG2_ORYRU
MVDPCMREASPTTNGERRWWPHPLRRSCAAPHPPSLDAASLPPSSLRPLSLTVTMSPPPPHCMPSSTVGATIGHLAPLAGHLDLHHAARIDLSRSWPLAPSAKAWELAVG